MYPTITAIILAGGQGSRMAGRDKGLVSWQGKNLVEHVISRIEPQTESLIISCNRNHDRYQLLTAIICSDSMAGYQGPLAGLQAALAIADSDLCLAYPCDTPHLPLDLLPRLLNTLQSEQAELCYADDGERQHYLPLLLKTSLLKELNQYLEDGGRSVKGWLAQLPVAVADFSDCPEAFININNDALTEP